MAYLCEWDGDEPVSTRALVGVEHTDGTLLARHVHLDGYPTAMVPVLAAVVHGVYGGDQSAAVAALTATHWSSLHHPDALAVPQAGLGEPSGNRGEPHRVPLGRPFAGDHEWAYLFFGDRLRVYLLVHRPRHRLAFVGWASWTVAALPHIAEQDLWRIQNNGYHARRVASWYLDLHHIDKYKDETGRW